MKCIIIIPCFNEAKRLPVKIFYEFLREQHSIQFIFVDDGSKDNTYQILKSINDSFPKHTDILKLPENRGKAEAVRYGMLLAISKKPDLVGFWDADLATPLNEIYRFVSVYSAYPNIKWVFGSRVKLLGRQIERNELRHYMGRVFATLVSFVLDLPIYDSQCGAKMFRADAALDTIISEKFKSKWIFDVELIARLTKYHKKTDEYSPHNVIYEIPLNTWTDVKESKLKIRDFFWAIIFLFQIWKYMHSNN
jgi:glycosyltransferase involved in cell wall biosynthesis